MTYSNNVTGVPRANVDQRPFIAERPVQTTNQNQKQVVETPHNKEVAISEEQLLMGLEKAIKYFRGQYTYLEFSVHEVTRRIAVKIHDSETGEVLKEIPPEKTLDFVAKLWEMAGILIDEKR